MYWNNRSKFFVEYNLGGCTKITENKMKLNEMKNAKKVNNLILKIYKWLKTCHKMEMKIELYNLILKFKKNYNTISVILQHIL